MTQIISALEFLNGRSKDFPEGLDPYLYAYKIAGSSFGLDTPIIGDLDINEGEMSCSITVADGRQRDGVGDLVHVEGVNTSRHLLNPIILYEHGKSVTHPIARARSDPKNIDTYSFRILPSEKKADVRAYFYQGTNDCAMTGDCQPGTHSQFCYELFDMCAKGFVQSGSIGYQVIAGHPLQPDYVSGLPQGLDLQKILLLECSLVVLPANPLTTAKSDKYLATLDYLQKCLTGGKINGSAPSELFIKSFTPRIPKRPTLVSFSKSNGTSGSQPQQQPQQVPAVRPSLTNPPKGSARVVGSQPAQQSQQSSVQPQQQVPAIRPSLTNPPKGAARVDVINPQPVSPAIPGIVSGTREIPLKEEQSKTSDPQPRKLQGSPHDVVHQYLSAFQQRLGAATPEQVQQMIEVNASQILKRYGKVAADYFTRKAQFLLQNHGDYQKATGKSLDKFALEQLEKSLKVPNYRKAEDSDESCQTCEYYRPMGGLFGACGLFQVGVTPDAVCDRWEGENGTELGEKALKHGPDCKCAKCQMQYGTKDHSCQCSECQKGHTCSCAGQKELDAEVKGRMGKVASGVAAAATAAGLGGAGVEGVRRAAQQPPAKVAQAPPAIKPQQAAPKPQPQQAQPQQVAPQTQPQEMGAQEEQVPDDEGSLEHKRAMEGLRRSVQSPSYTKIPFQDPSQLTKLPELGPELQPSPQTPTSDAGEPSSRAEITPEQRAARERMQSRLDREEEVRLGLRRGQLPDFERWITKWKDRDPKLYAYLQKLRKENPSRLVQLYWRNAQTLRSLMGLDLPETIRPPKSLEGKDQKSVSTKDDVDRNDFLAKINRQAERKKLIKNGQENLEHTNKSLLGYAWDSKSLKDLRLKWRSPAGKFHRSRRGSPGSIHMNLAISDLNSLRDDATSKGVEVKWVSEDGKGSCRVKLIGMDPVLEDLAKTYAKAINKAEKKMKNLPNTSEKKVTDVGRNLLGTLPHQPQFGVTPPESESLPDEQQGSKGRERQELQASHQRKNPDSTQFQDDLPPSVPVSTTRENDTKNLGQIKKKAADSNVSKPYLPEDGKGAGPVDETNVQQGYSQNANRGALEAGDYKTKQGPEPEGEESAEPYGAQVLRRWHADAAGLLHEYDEMMELLENPKVRQLGIETLQWFSSQLDKLEDAWSGEESFGGLSPLEGSQSEKEGEEENLEGGQAESAETSSKPTTGRLDKEPTPAEALKGMERQEQGTKTMTIEDMKSLYYQRIKALRNQHKKSVEVKNIVAVNSNGNNNGKSLNGVNVKSLQTELLSLRKHLMILGNREDSGTKSMRMFLLKKLKKTEEMKDTLLHSTEDKKHRPGSAEEKHGGIDIETGKGKKEVNTGKKGGIPMKTKFADTQSPTSEDSTATGEGSSDSSMGALGISGGIL